MRELSITEYLELDSYLHKCGWFRNGASIFWDERVDFGRFDLLSGKIRIMDKPSMIRNLAPCVIHELTHRIQARRYGKIGYALRNLTRTMLEPEAIENERKAEKTLGITL